MHAGIGLWRRPAATWLLMETDVGGEVWRYPLAFTVMGVGGLSEIEMAGTSRLVAQSGLEGEVEEQRGRRMAEAWHGCGSPRTR